MLAFRISSVRSGIYFKGYTPKLGAYVAKYHFSLKEASNMITKSTMSKQWEMSNPRYLTGNGEELAIIIMNKLNNHNEKIEIEHWILEKTLWLGRLIYKVAFKLQISLEDAFNKVTSSISDLNAFLHQMMINGVLPNQMVNEFCL